MTTWEWGPTYNIDGATLTKWRRLARQRELTREEKRAYGAAVENTVKAKQKSEFMRASVEPGHRHPCASGTAYTTGEEIHNAIRAQQAAQLLAYPAQVRRERDPLTWRNMYNYAMEEKHGPDWQPKGN